jgi:hypothetical protein
LRIPLKEEIAGGSRGDRGFREGDFADKFIISKRTAREILVFVQGFKF